MDARTTFLVALAEPNARRRARWAAAIVLEYCVRAAKNVSGGEFDHDRVLLALTEDGPEGSTTRTLTGSVRTGLFRPTARDWLGQQVIVAEIVDRYGSTAKIVLKGTVHKLENVNHT